MAGPAILRLKFQALSSLCYLLMTSGKLDGFHSCVWDVMFGGHTKAASPECQPSDLHLRCVLCIEDTLYHWFADHSSRPQGPIGSHRGVGH